MGCAASSNAPASPKKYRTGGESSDEGSMIGSRTNSVVSSNQFTTSYATGANKPRKYVPQYKPGSSEADTEAEFEKWKSKNKSKTAASGLETAVLVKPEKIVEDFVFGDFKVDPFDVQQQRIERFNRVRHPAPAGGTLGHHSASGKNLLSALSLSRRKSQGNFVMNDFSVKTVDEGDDLSKYTFLHEVKVPEGFRRLQRYSVRHVLSHCNRVKVVAMSPSETEFASCSTEDNTLSMHDAATGDETTSFSGHSAPIVSAVFSRDGKYLATSSRDNTIIVWDTMHKDNAKRLIRTLDHPCLPICVEFSFDAVLLVSGCQDKKCRVWNIQSSEVCATFDEHEGVVVCVATHSKKAVAVSGGGDRTLRLWDLTTGASTLQFIGHDGIIISVNFTPDGDRILSNDDRACKLWNAETGACLLNVTLQSLTSSVSGSDFPPPMPLPASFLHKTPLTSKQLGFAPSGILGPVATNACKIGANRSVFTLSCFLPGVLSRSYFAVASTNRMVYIISCLNGKEEAFIHAKSSVFALGAGREGNLIFGDIFGNVSIVSVVAKEN